MIRDSAMNAGSDPGTDLGNALGADRRPDFVYAVSLLAAIEGAAGQSGNEHALAFLGLARAEMVDFGQRRPAQFVEVRVHDVASGLSEIEKCLTALIEDSKALRETLRLEAARGFVRRCRRDGGDGMPALTR